MSGELPRTPRSQLLWWWTATGLDWTGLDWTGLVVNWWTGGDGGGGDGCDGGFSDGKFSQLQSENLLKQSSHTCVTFQH